MVIVNVWYWLPSTSAELSVPDPDRWSRVAPLEVFHYEVLAIVSRTTTNDCQRWDHKTTRKPNGIRYSSAGHSDGRLSARKGSPSDGRLSARKGSFSDHRDAWNRHLI